MSGGHPGADPALAVIMPTISWEGSFEPCARRVLELLRPGDRFVVVFDGESPPAPAWLQRAEVELLATGHRAGPGVARNLGARTASAPMPAVKPSSPYCSSAVRYSSSERSWCSLSGVRPGSRTM